MLQNLKNPPEPFQEVIRTHFRLKANSIIKQLDNWVSLDDNKPTNSDGAYIGPTTIGATGIVLSACYSIYLYNRLSYGLYSPHLKPVKDINRLEFNVLITLLIPTILLGIFPNVILDALHLSVSSLLYNLPLIKFNNINNTYLIY